MMEQQQRHQYLDALGITSWLPQQPLSGAAPSEDWVWDFRYPAPEIPFSEGDYDDYAGDSSDAMLQPGNADPRLRPRPKKMQPSPQSREAARAMLAQTLGAELDAKPKPKPAAAAVASPQQPLTEPVTPAATNKPDPRFKLAFVQTGPLLLIDSLPTQGQDGFTEHHQNLAQAICSALQSGLPAFPPATLLPWPMFVSKTIDQGYEQAQIAIRHKLKRALVADVKVMLLFGEAAAQMVLERDEELDELRGAMFSYRPGIKALATRSLTEAMHVPGVKRDIWLDLQPVVKFLRNE
ncbi:uracil-DNA glycosylase family protein [Marinobacterium jannaschii]|uniref:hypothetical protein n=1 Tax=Marinobacterium jannaschii TaxID=64970 RepID=UPI0004836010|nr:hypothetical protein [Marinobacterium jannaschii]